GVKRQLVPAEFPAARGEAIGREISSRMRVPLISYENIRERPIEQHHIEVVVSFLQPRIFHRRDRDRLIDRTLVHTTSFGFAHSFSLPAWGWIVRLKPRAFGGCGNRTRKIGSPIWRGSPNRTRKIGCAVRSGHLWALLLLLNKHPLLRRR